MKNWINLLGCFFVLIVVSLIFISAINFNFANSDFNKSSDFTKIPSIPDASINAEEITQTSQPYSEYIVYHLGTTSCPPCKRMIRGVWKDPQVISVLKQNDAKLWILNADNRKHQKYFSYYKIRSYPTIMIFDRRNLQRPIYRGSYMSKDEFLRVVRAYL